MSRPVIMKKYNVKKLENDYKNHTQRELAELYGVSLSKINNILKDNKIKNEKSKNIEDKYIKFISRVEFLRKVCMRCHLWTQNKNLYWIPDRCFELAGCYNDNVGCFRYNKDDDYIYINKKYKKKMG